jgi:hypothetical protein
MRKIIIISLLVSVVFTGCLYAIPDPPRASEPTSSYYYEQPTPNVLLDSPAPIADNGTGGVIYDANKPTSGSAATIEARMIDVNWISPGKVTISNLYKGAQAEYTMRIHNGGTEASIFNISMRQPDGSGFNKLPLDCLNWVSAPLYVVYIPSKGTYELPITVKMLTDTNMKGKEYEFWVSVIQGSQKGMIQTELCSRWLISTRK